MWSTTELGDFVSTVLELYDLVLILIIFFRIRLPKASPYMGGKIDVAVAHNDGRKKKRENSLYVRFAMYRFANEFCAFEEFEILTNWKKSLCIVRV